MELNLILFVLLGFVTYWVVKIPGTIRSKSPINTIAAFLHENVKELILSIIGLCVLILAGNDIPTEWGKIDGPITAFIAGGSIPSMFMNFTALLFQKK
jgi:uncharacterized membrane protein